MRVDPQGKPVKFRLAHVPTEPGEKIYVLEVPPERILQKGRLQPGRMFLIDTEEGRIVADEELKRKISHEHPYRQWLEEHMVELADLPEPPHVPEPSHENVLQRQQAFG